MSIIKKILGKESKGCGCGFDLDAQINKAKESTNCSDSSCCSEKSDIKNEKKS